MHSVPSAVAMSQLPVFDTQPTFDDVLTWSWRKLDKENRETSKKQLQLAHNMFISNKMSLENYTTEIIKFLVGESGSPEAVYEFVGAFSTSLQAGTFSSEDAFAQTLRDRFKDFKFAKVA